MDAQTIRDRVSSLLREVAVLRSESSDYFRKDWHNKKCHAEQQEREMRLEQILLELAGMSKKIDPRD